MRLSHKGEHLVAKKAVFYLGGAGFRDNNDPDRHLHETDIEPKSLANHPFYSVPLNRIANFTTDRKPQARYRCTPAKDEGEIRRVESTATPKDPPELTALENPVVLGKASGGAPHL